ncbi:sensor domain-containing protein [Faunimonas sp. B44]|uniref:sensor domain-containing protein n=1 Tax=Faunimonas sp. B44 TaxID=3461493 RepID=UPI0040440EAE
MIGSSPERPPRTGALEPNEERYRALLATNTALVFVTDPRGAVVDFWGWDDQACEFRDTLKGFRWQDALHPDDRARVVSTWFHAVRSGACDPFRYRLKSPDGSYRWMVTRAVPLRDGNGNIREWVGTTTDIHEQHDAADRLSRNEERLRVAVDATGLGIWDFDYRTGQRWWSDGKRALLGIPDGDPIGLEAFLALVHPDDRARLDAEIARVFDPAIGRLEADFRIRRADDGAERWLASSGRAFFASDGMLLRMIGVARDVTGRKRAEEAVRSTEQRFRKVASSSPNACVLFDEAGNVTFWNEGAEGTFGYTPEEAVGRSVELIFPGDLSDRLTTIGSGDKGELLETVGRHRNGRVFPVEATVSSWLEGGRRNFCILARDVTEQREQQERLFRFAHYDQLTGLPNRRLIWSRISDALDRDTPGALLLVDLSRFKEVNDSMGHAGGDRLLVEVAGRLRAAVADHATVARLGGDEFAIWLPGASEPTALEGVVDAIMKSVVRPIRIGSRTISVGGSVGTAIAPEHGRTIDELMLNADLALYSAKADSSSSSRVFSPALRAEKDERQRLERELRTALKRGEFELHYQPQVRLGSGEIIGAEALIRWRHPERGLLAPGVFLPILKALPIAQAVGDWTMAEACREAARLRSSGAGIRMAVNLFQEQFRGGRLVEVVEQALAANALPPECLELEITETILLDGDETILTTLSRLRDLGVQIAFDDYGTGYASLSLLKNFPLTRLKIDRSFVQTVIASKGDIAIIDAVVQLGRSFGLGVIAEGVENAMQERILLSLGCSEAQGFLYSPAVPADDLLALLLLQGEPASWRGGARHYA